MRVNSRSQMDPSLRWDDGMDRQDVLSPFAR